MIPTQLLDSWWWRSWLAGGGCIAPHSDGRFTRLVFPPRALRYAGIPVARRISFVYALSGLAASLAAIIYVAHLGQAKSDAGTGYELMAITAVVLGGASIFGGRGTILGTVLGLFAIVILQNGLRLSAQPAELAGILTGVLLVATILFDRLMSDKLQFVADLRKRLFPPANEKLKVVGQISEEEFEVKNSQVAVLSAVILIGALLVAGSNWMLVRSLRPEATGTGSRGAGPTTAGGHKPVIAMMPKAKGDPYFISCRQGAEEAAKELGVELLWDGPTDLDPAKQNEVVEAWITRGVDVIAVSVENKVGISTVLRKAREKGIKVITWDADAEKDARDFLINQATPQGIGYTLTDGAAKSSQQQRRVRDHHCFAERGQSERVDQIHQGAPGAKVSGHEAGGDSAERRRPRPRLLGNADGAQGLSKREIDHGDCRARSSRSRRSREAIGPRGCQSHRPVAAQHVQALCPRGRDRSHRALEHVGPGLPDGLCRQRAGDGPA